MPDHNPLRDNILWLHTHSALRSLSGLSVLCLLIYLNSEYWFHIHPLVGIILVVNLIVDIHVVLSISPLLYRARSSTTATGTSTSKKSRNPAAAAEDVVEREVVGVEDPNTSNKSGGGNPWTARPLRFPNWALVIIQFLILGLHVLGYAFTCLYGGLIEISPLAMYWERVHMFYQGLFLVFAIVESIIDLVYYRRAKKIREAGGETSVIPV